MTWNSTPASGSTASGSTRARRGVCATSSTNGVRGRNRAVKAEQAWDNFLDGVGGGMWDSVRGFFSGRRR